VATAIANRRGRSVHACTQAMRIFYTLITEVQIGNSDLDPLVLKEADL
jgi:hypothetical protein